MKNTLVFLMLFIAYYTYGQTITVSPSAFNENEEVTITVSDFDPVEAWGVTDIYLWAWYFDANGDFGGNAPETGTDFGNSPNTALFTDNGDDTFSYTFVPTSFYDASEISRIGFLVKSQDGTNQTNDNLVDVGSFQLQLIAPTQSQTLLSAGEVLGIMATTTTSANFTLTANGTIIDTADATTTYANNSVVNENTEFLLEASNGTDTERVSFTVFIRPTVEEQALPSGLVDGLNVDPLDPTRATLVLFAPDKEFVHVIGDFNNWELDNNFLMKKDVEQDRFWLEITNLTPQFDHMYQYVVDGSIRIADPYSEVVLDEFNDPFINEIGNSVYPNLPAYPVGLTSQIVTLMRLGDPEFDWEITDFQRPEVSDLVIYELLIRDFDSRHSFSAVVSRLDYLVSLGINAIELMPISEFDGNVSWGYNPAFHMALDKYYGDQNAFKSFVDACHARGIAVILDVVYNQATGQHPYFRMYNECGGDFDCPVSPNNPFFNVSDPNSAFQFFNDLNHESEATQQYVDRMNRFWLEEYRVDGYRFDFTKGFTNTPGDGNGFDQARIDLLTRMYDQIRNFDEDAYVILEHFAPNSEETILINHRATNKPDEFGMLVWGNHNFNYNEATLGFHANGGSDFSAISYLNRGWDTPSNVGYMESHDEERLMYKNLEFGNSQGDYNVQNFTTALDRQKLAGTFYFTVPGPKFLWQFGELGYEFPINRCPDGSINNACRTDPKPIPFNLGFDTNLERMALYEFWADLIMLKREEPIFNTNTFSIDAGNANGLKRIQLTDNTANGEAIKHITILGNFGVTTQSITPEFQETGTWYNLLNNNSPLEITDVNTAISLEPGAFIIFANEPSTVLLNPNDLDADGVDDTEDVCLNTPFGAVVDVDGCEIFTLPVENFAIRSQGETCRSSDNGRIEIAALQALNYTASLQGNNFDEQFTFTTDLSITNLSAGTYELCIGVENQPTYAQCSTLIITQPELLSVTSSVNLNAESVTLLLDGAAAYEINLNGTLFTTSETSITLHLNRRENTLEIATDRICQGVYRETIFVVDQAILYPNPVGDALLYVTLPRLQNQDVTFALYSYSGSLVTRKNDRIHNNQLIIDMSGYDRGLYVLSLSTASETMNYRIIKE